MQDLNGHGATEKPDAEALLTQVSLEVELWAGCLGGFLELGGVYIVFGRTDQAKLHLTARAANLELEAVKAEEENGERSRPCQLAQTLDRPEEMNRHQSRQSVSTGEHEITVITASLRHLQWNISKVCVCVCVF